MNRGETGETNSESRWTRVLGQICVFVRVGVVGARKVSEVQHNNCHVLYDAVWWNESPLTASRQLAK